MPRDLFGDVTRPSISVGGRKWYTLPVSLLSHSLIVALVVAAPILAPAILPLIAQDMGDIVIITVPKPPPPPTLRPASAQPVASTNAAPITAPDAITRETGLEAGFEDAASLSIIGGDIAGDITHGVVEPPPLPPPAVQKPLRVGGAIRTPVKVRDVAPVYPPIAQAARVQGIVILEATIGADGRVANARVLRSVSLLDHAALEAVRQWEFTPTLLNGAPVPVVMTVTVSFVLR